MAQNDVVITVTSRDRSDPAKVRARWRAAGRQIEQDSKESGERSGKGWLKGFGDGADDTGGLGSVMKRITGSFTSAFQISAKSAATAFSAQFLASVASALASGAAKIAHGLASIAALLPAAALAGAAAFGTLKLAVSGVGDALDEAMTGDAKAFDEAIKGLSPHARSFAREVRGMRDRLMEFRNAVQDRFFAQFEGQTSRLAKTWLPTLRRELGAMAEAFGDTVNNFAKWAQQPRVVLTLTMALRQARGAVANLLAGATHLADAFLPLIAVGSTFLPRLTRGFGDATAKLALFMQHAADTGSLADFIQGGLDKLKSLGDTFGQLWRIGGNVIAVLRDFGAVGGGVFAALGLQTGGLLDSLEALTQKARVFFETGSGGQAITEIFGILRSLLNATFGTLAHLVPILGRAFAPILPQLSEFAEAIVNLQYALADALAPALSAVASVLGTVLPPLTDVLNLIADNGPAAAALAGALLGVYAAWKLFAAGAALAKLNLTAIKLTTAGAVAGVGALSMALIQINAQQHEARLDGLVEAFTALDGAVNDQTRTMLYAAQVMGQQDEFVSKLIDSNPRLAQTLIDNADAYGITTEDAARYQDQLDTTTAAIENQTDALTRQKNAMRAATDPVFAAMDAQQRLADAQAHLTELEKSGTATSAELQQAHQDVAQAAFDLEAAQYDLAAAVESGETSVEAYLASLKRQVKQGAITRADYNALALTAVASFGATKRAIEGVPRSHSTTLSARDLASGVAAKVRAKMNQLNGMTAVVNIVANVASDIANAFFAHGGITGAAGGGPRSRRTWVGEHGPELVDLPPGSHVYSNPDSRRMAAQGGGQMYVTIGFDERRLGPLGQLLVKALRVEVRNDGGNVQAVLGAR